MSAVVTQHIESAVLLKYYSGNQLIKFMTFYNCKYLNIILLDKHSVEHTIHQAYDITYVQKSATTCYGTAHVPFLHSKISKFSYNIYNLIFNIQQQF